MRRRTTRGLRRAAVALMVAVVLALTALFAVNARAPDTHREQPAASQGAEDAAGIDGLEVFDRAAPSSAATFLDDLERASLEQRDASAKEQGREGASSEDAAEAGASAGDVPASTLDAASAQGAVAVAWTTHETLPQAAAALLEAYRDTGGSRLMTSGYLDVRGMVWGMVATGDAGWVDIAFVYAGESDNVATVRVARLRPPA